MTSNKGALIVLLISSILFLYSCSPFYQLFETKPSSSGISQDKFYCFENDTVKIKYTFWEEKGTVCLSIYNKLKIPLYIDWKKSSFIRNGEKMDFWQDATTTNSRGSSSGNSSFLFGHFNSFGLVQSSSVSVKPQRIDFIARQSTTSKIKFLLYEEKPIPLKGNSQLNYTVDSSPLVFRTFFTFSLSEKFENESYINNTFYVSRIKQIPQREFLGKAIGTEGGKAIYEYPFKSPTCFYVIVK